MLIDTQLKEFVGVLKRPFTHNMRQQWLFGAGISVSLALLTIGLVPTGNASLEVLSDMDCVIEPSAMVNLGSAVPGLISNAYYDRSDFVSAGTIMAQLESKVERVTLSIAEQVAGSTIAVNLREATAQFGDRTRQRNEQLMKTSGLSKQALDQVVTESTIASLQVTQERENQRLALLDVARAKALLDRREMRSPISGTVVQRYKTAGEYVDNEPVYQIAQLDPLNVEVIVPISNLKNIEAGMSAGVTINAPGFDNTVLSATVRRIDAVADAASATYGIRLTLENPDFTIPSGVRCTVDFFAS